MSRFLRKNARLSTCSEKLSRRDWLEALGFEEKNWRRSLPPGEGGEVHERDNGKLDIPLPSFPNTTEAFLGYFSFADSLYWSVKTDKRDDPRGEPQLIGGSPYIHERIGEVTYLIHPNSFFQTNSYALPLLIKAVENFASGEMILDLYAGVGTFGVWLAKRRFQVEGIELNPFAVEIANKNAEINNVDATFKVGRAEETLIGKYDTVVVDPRERG